MEFNKGILIKTSNNVVIKNYPDCEKIYWQIQNYVKELYYQKHIKGYGIQYIYDFNIIKIYFTISEVEDNIEIHIKKIIRDEKLIQLGI